MSVLSIQGIDVGQCSFLQIRISVDGLSPGEYNYTISVTDLGSNSVSDQVTVTVEAAATSTIPTSTTSTTTTQTTTTETPPAPPIPMEDILLVVLTWVGTSVLILLVAEGIIRKTR